MKHFCRCDTTPGVKAGDFDGIFHWRWDCSYLNDKERATCKALYTEEARAKGLLDDSGDLRRPGPLPAKQSSPPPAPSGSTR